MEDAERVSAICLALMMTYLEGVKIFKLINKYV